MSTGRNNVKRSNITACRRCKTRKQRCDQDVPACGNCKRAGVECVGVGADGFPEPRSYIKSLEDYVAKLEAQLASSASNNDGLHSNGLNLGSRMAAVTIPKWITQDQEICSPIFAQVTIPEHPVLMDLSMTYFEHSNFFSPILDESEMADLSKTARSEEDASSACVRSKFAVYMMLSTTMELMQRSRSNMHMPQPEPYRIAAFGLLQNDVTSIFTDDIRHIECLLLIVQSLAFASDLENCWHFIGLATRLAISLDLHCEGTYSHMNKDANNQARRLFWTLYSLERNLCVVLGRPFSIPDTAITTLQPAPSADSGISIFAKRQIAYRRLESEIYQITQEGAPSYCVLDKSQWRINMQRRLHEWRESIPDSLVNSKLAPNSIWGGAVSNALLRVYYPSKYTYDLSHDEYEELRRAATDTIQSYRQSFRDKELRFYWRTLHFLYLAAEALLLCANHLHTQMLLETESFGSIKETLHCAANVLWGMVEHYPKSDDYRDRFDDLLFQLTALKPTSSTNMFPLPQPMDLYSI